MGLIVALFLFFGCKNENKKIEYMVTFAKVYGYVKYFHPSDEASQIDWNKFSIYGASEIDKCRSKKDLLTTLNRLFEPIAPSIKFSNKINYLDAELFDIAPDSIENYKLTYWQHFGVSLGMDREKQPYESRRINREDGMGENRHPPRLSGLSSIFWRYYTPSRVRRTYREENCNYGYKRTGFSGIYPLLMLLSC